MRGGGDLLVGWGVGSDLLVGWGMEVSVDGSHECRLDEILPPVKDVAARTLQPTPETIHLSTAMTRVDSGHLISRYGQL